jgi:hypothetical protein
VTVIAIAAAVVCIRLVDLVPGAINEDGTFTNDFWLNAFFMVLGFLVTTATVSPIVALFLDWRSNREWRIARLNVRDRLADSLSQMLSSYRIFLRTVAEGDLGVSMTFLAQTHQALVDFFDTYESEQSAFNAQMHSAASNLRQHLLPFKRSVESSSAMIGRMRSFRLYLGERTLDDVRSVFELLPLAPTGRLAGNTYFARHGELYLDVRLDLQLGAGVIPIHRFAALTLATLRLEWASFLRACPADGDSTPPLTMQLEEDEDTQARLHAAYVRHHIKEKYIADLVVEATLAEGLI